MDRSEGEAEASSSGRPSLEGESCQGAIKVRSLGKRVRPLFLQRKFCELRNIPPQSGWCPNWKDDLAGAQMAKSPLCLHPELE